MDDDRVFVRAVVEASIPRWALADLLSRSSTRLISETLRHDENSNVMYQLQAPLRWMAEP